MLVHGFALDTRMWDDQFEPFSQRYRVVRYDLRGFGRSAEYRDEPSYHHEDLRALLDYLNMEQAHIVALSLGGGISLEFALDHPDRLKSLTLADAIVWGFEWTDDGGLGAIWGAGQREGAEAARRLWLEHPQFAAARRTPRWRRVCGRWSPTTAV